MPQLTDFLLARIADDEAAADRLELCPYFGGDPGNGALHISAARVLAECEAKRQIVDLAREAEREASMDDWHVEQQFFEGRLSLIEAALQALALPYADHADFRDEWRP